MTQSSKYNYGPSLCLWTNTVPTYSHTHMLTHVVHFWLQTLINSNLVITYPACTLCFPQTITLLQLKLLTPGAPTSQDSITSSSIWTVAFHVLHQFEYRLRHSTCTLSCLLHNLFYLTLRKLRWRKSWEGAAHKLKPHCLLWPSYTKSGHSDNSYNSDRIRYSRNL
jgi:hypothetical protein